MGAIDQYFTVRTGSLEAVKKAYDDRVQNDCWDYGNGGYTGSFAESPGLTVTGKQFPDRDAAYDYLEQTIKKWANSLAVGFKDNGDQYWLVGGCFCS